MDCRHLRLTLALIYLCMSVVKSNVSTSQMENGDDDDMSCPTWTKRESLNGSSSECECGDGIAGRVLCNPKTDNVYVLNCFCISYDHIHRRSVFGACIYNCFHPNSGDDTSEEDSDDNQYIIGKINLFYHIPRNKSRLDESCHHLNRSGLLCGDCKEGFVPPVFSYDIKCINCTTSHSLQYAKIFLTILLPQTVFFLLALLFRVRLNLPEFNAFLCVSQILGSKAFLRVAVQALNHSDLSNGVKALCKVLISVYGIWNLDFFRVYFSSFCIPNTDTITVLQLEFLPALYPLCLTLLAFVFIELHARGCKIVFILCMPVSKLCSRFRRKWEIRNSIIDTFAMFLLLSYLKIVATSFDILTPTILRNIHGSFDGLISYHQPSSSVYHTGVTLLAAIFSLLIVLMPLLLLLFYPIKRLRKCVAKICCKSPHLKLALKSFMDSFHGYFKDGTQPGTYDHRYMAGMYLLFRLMAYSLYMLTLYVNYVPLVMMMTITLALYVCIVRPYKTSHAMYNVIDPLFFGHLAFIFLPVSALGNATLRSKNLVPVYFFTIIFLFLLPLIYLALIGLKFVLNTSLRHKMCSRMLGKFSRKRRNSTESENGCLLRNTEQDMPTYSSLAIK